MPTDTLAMGHSNIGMLAELKQAPEAVRRQEQALARPLAELVRWCRRTPPPVVLTCARGSSAHAATFGKHLIERHLGLPVGAAAPNIATLYRRRLALKGHLLLTVSQSGRSEDLIEFTTMAKSAGALTAAIVNDSDSPLARVCDIPLPMAAGPEVSVAATKTFVATCAVLLRLTAAWTDDLDLRAAIERLPHRLAEAGEIDWSTALATLVQANSLITIGRGPTLAIAREAALKLKELCDLHAEAFSGAEFRHGPMALVSPRYPLVLFMPTDEAGIGLREFAADLRHKGAAVLATGEGGPDQGLRALPPDHPDTDAVCLIQSFYALAVRLAERRGTDIEQPRHLQKVTRTR
jgi:glucosamine--fructose-6-phosphate aminotransferase (isomerizing)